MSVNAYAAVTGVAAILAGIYGVHILRSTRATRPKRPVERLRRDAYFMFALVFILLIVSVGLWLTNYFDAFVIAMIGGVPVILTIIYMMRLMRQNEEL